MDPLGEPPFHGGFAMGQHLDEQIKKTPKEQCVAPKHPSYLPNWNPVIELSLPTPSEHHDPALSANPKFPYLTGLLNIDKDLKPLTPKTVTEITGLQLTHARLGSGAKSELALLVAQRKVVVLRDQEFCDLPPEKALEWCKFFGRPITHPIGPYVGAAPEVSVLYSGDGDTSINNAVSKHTTCMTWHFEGEWLAQPPGMVVVWMLEGPNDGGGDIVFCDMVRAYGNLSAPFRERLHGLEAEHVVERGGSTVHPVVRTHPVTAEKALWVSPIYTTRIVGYKKEESDILLKFLYDHISYGQEFQVRLRWTEGTVVMFDNRVACYSNICDFSDTSRRRHHARVSLEAEKPFQTPATTAIRKPRRTRSWDGNAILARMKEESRVEPDKEWWRAK